MGVRSDRTPLRADDEHRRGEVDLGRRERGRAEERGHAHRREDDGIAEHDAAKTRRGEDGNVEGRVRHEAHLVDAERLRHPFERILAHQRLLHANQGDIFLHAREEFVVQKRRHGAVQARGEDDGRTRAMQRGFVAAPTSMERAKRASAAV